MLSSVSSEAASRYGYSCSKAHSPLYAHKTAIDYLEEIYGALPQLPLGRRLFPIVRGDVHVAHIAEHQSLGSSNDEFREAGSSVEYLPASCIDSTALESRRVSDIIDSANEERIDNDEEEARLAEGTAQPTHTIFNSHKYKLKPSYKRQRLDAC